MRKSITGFIFGLFTVIAAVLGIFVKIFLKLMEIDSIREWFVDSIHTGIRLIIFGEKRQNEYAKYRDKWSRPNYNTNYYHKLSASYQYCSMVKNELEGFEFKSIEEARAAREKIFDEFDTYGTIRVRDILDILDPDEKKLQRRYLDLKFGWNVMHTNEWDIVASLIHNTWHLSISMPNEIYSQKSQTV